MQATPLAGRFADPEVFAQITIDPNELIDTTDVGWPELIAAVVTVLLALLAASLIRRFLRRAMQRWPHIESHIAGALIRLAGWVVIALGVAFALLFLGFEIGPVFLILAILAAVVIVMGRPLMENIGAGVVLQAETPFRVGDMVDILGEMGIVREISYRATVIDTFDGKRLRIPNNQVLNSSIVNISERGARRSEIRVGVEYGTDLDQTRDVIVEALSQIDIVYDEPSPRALVDEFGDSAIVFRVWFWYEPLIDGAAMVTDEVARAVDRTLRRRGIVIAFPQRVVWTRGSADGGGNEESGTVHKNTTT